MRLFRWIFLPLVAALILSTAGLVSAQAVAPAAGAISGTTTDAQTGDSIQGALVEVESTGDFFSAETGVDGTYQIPGVPPGQYSVTASADGYEGETETGVGVTEGGTALVDFSLQPSAAEEEGEGGRQPGNRKGFVGTFSLGDGDFTVTTKKEVVVIRIPDSNAAGVSVVDGLVDGDKVAVLVEFLPVDGVADLVAEARQVKVKLAPQLPVVGAVVSVVTNEEGVRTMNIMLPNGTAQELLLGAEVNSPGIGDVVTAFPGGGARGRGRGDGDVGELPTATGLVLADQVLERLEGFLQDLTAEDSNLPRQAAERRDQQVTQVAAILESHASQHVNILQKLIDKPDLPTQAVLGMLNHLEQAKAGRDRANAKAKEARDKVALTLGGGRPESSGPQGNQGQGRGP